MSSEVWRELREGDDGVMFAAEQLRNLSGTSPFQLELNCYVVVFLHSHTNTKDEIRRKTDGKFHRLHRKMHKYFIVYKCKCTLKLQVQNPVTKKLR